MLLDCPKKNGAVQLGGNLLEELVSLRTLAKHGYLVFQPNTGKLINDNVRETESMWQLTDSGHQFAETYYSSLLRPKRSYVKS